MLPTQPVAVELHPLPISAMLRSVPVQEEEMQRMLQSAAVRRVRASIQMLVVSAMKMRIRLICVKVPVEWSLTLPAARTLEIFLPPVASLDHVDALQILRN